MYYVEKKKMEFGKPKALKPMLQQNIMSTAKTFTMDKKKSIFYLEIFLEIIFKLKKSSDKRKIKYLWVWYRWHELENDKAFQE